MRLKSLSLNRVSLKYDREFVPKMSAIAREGRYKPWCWKKLTGKMIEELEKEWRARNWERIQKEKAGNAL